jgi:hypothetical protein
MSASSQGRGLYIHGKRDLRFDGKCLVCGALMLDAAGVEHTHPGEPGSVFDEGGRRRPVPPPMPFPPNEFQCPFCPEGHVDFQTGAHGTPVCRQYMGLTKALDAWADRLNDLVVTRRRVGASQSHVVAPSTAPTSPGSSKQRLK